MRRHFRISRIVLQPATSQTFAFRMDSQLDNRNRKPLVTVEFQTEVDIATGNRERRMFVKMYFDARDSGLLAALPDELWKTLCCLATYMDENGNCYPSQARLASDLGIRREHMNKGITRLLSFRFHGEPIITMTKSRESGRGGSRWANNVYHLRSITGLAMFEEKDALNWETPMEGSQPSLYVAPTSHRASELCVLQRSDRGAGVRTCM